MSGIIFDIQSYAIYDGPGIRTCVYFKGCPLNCYWCHNPESQDPKPEMGYWEERCARCGSCLEACTNKALSLEENGIQRDYKVCAACGECVKACPNQAMEKIGYETTARDIMEKVMRDKPFFDNSKGGVTVSGGEPTHQKDFLFEVLEAVKDTEVHTAIETCGYFAGDLIEPLAERVDLFLYDLKHMNSEVHKQATGAGNEKIMDNFRKILKKIGSERIIPRVPLIPGFNTDMASITDLITFIGEQGYRGPVHLMPHHGWARGKYQRIGRGDSFRDPGLVSSGEIKRIERVIIQAGLEPVLHG